MIRHNGTTTAPIIVITAGIWRRPRGEASLPGVMAPRAYLIRSVVLLRAKFSQKRFVCQLERSPEVEMDLDCGVCGAIQYRP